MCLEKKSLSFSKSPLPGFTTKIVLIAMVLITMVFLNPQNQCYTGPPYQVFLNTRNFTVFKYLTKQNGEEEAQLEYNITY